MGSFLSSRRRDNYYRPPLPSPQLSPPPPPLPPPPSTPYPHSAPSTSGFSPPPATYAFAGNAPYSSSPYPNQEPYAPPPQNYYSNYSCYPNGSSVHGPMMVRPSYPYYANQNNGWSLVRPPMAPHPRAPPVPPPPYVEHQKATTIKNDVNLRKETIRLEVDEEKPDHHLVSFIFDATVDGSITIFYFAKEGTNCSFSPHYPEIYKPMRVPFQKGLGQKFRQASGTGIDLGFFELDDLSKPQPNEVFPLVISVEACLLLPTEEHPGPALPTKAGNTQITQAIIEKKNDEAPFQVKVIQQILCVDGIRYELHEIYGIGNSTEEEFDDNDPGKECVICLSEPKDTAVLPCRHMCMCSECAKVLRLQSNRCPICRQPVEQLMEIKSKKGKSLVRYYQTNIVRDFSTSRKMKQQLDQCRITVVEALFSHFDWMDPSVMIVTFDSARLEQRAPYTGPSP